MYTKAMSSGKSQAKFLLQFKCVKFGCIPVNRIQGFTLIELMVFIVVIAVGLGGVLSVFINTTNKSVQPLVQLRTLELAQAQLDRIISRKYDTNSPAGGVPACSAGTIPCDGFNAADNANCDDIDDFNDAACAMASPYPGYSLAVTVSFAGSGAGSGADLPGLSAADTAKLVTVTVSGPDGVSFSLSTYRTNF